MKKINLTEINQFIDHKMLEFNQKREQYLQAQTFEELIIGNPYIFLVRKTQSAGRIIGELLDSNLLVFEEELINSFLKQLAIFVASKTCDGHKSVAPGVDLEFFNQGFHYVVSVKSGPNWGNSSQQKKLEEDLRNAVMRARQLDHGANVQAVLGICYGKNKTGYLRGYLKVVGQNFWYLISENKDLYTEIIEPIGYEAREHDEAFSKQKGGITNSFTKLFIERFCDTEGIIDWARLVEFNCGNFDLEKFIPNIQERS